MIFYNLEFVVKFNFYSIFFYQLHYNEALMRIVSLLNGAYHPQYHHQDLVLKFYMVV